MAALRRKQVTVRREALLLLGALLTAGVSHTAAAQSPRLEKSDITIGVLPITNYAAVHLGAKEGLFKEQGLNVTLRMMGAASPVAALVGGDYDAAGITWPAMLLAYNRGIPLLPVSETDRATPGSANYVVKADSRYQKAADLVGKKVGVVTLGGVCDLILNDVLRAEGLDFKAVSYTPIGVPDMAPTLLRGGIDAACLPEPLLTAAKAQGGIRSIMDLFADQYRDWPLTSYPVTEKFAQANPNTLAAMRRALETSLKFAHDNPAKVRDILPTYTTLTPEAASRISLPFFPEKSDFTQANRVADLMDRLNLLPTKLKRPPIVEGR